MSKELSPKYNPAEVEAGRYQTWLDQDVFKPSGDAEAKPYSIVIPPPNVTGKLHLGHAWDTTLQDIIIRQKRMQGFDTLWYLVWTTRGLPLRLRWRSACGSKA